MTVLAIIFASRADSPVTSIFTFVFFIVLYFKEHYPGFEPVLIQLSLLLHLGFGACCHYTKNAGMLSFTYSTRALIHPFFQGFISFNKTLIFGERHLYGSDPSVTYITYQVFSNKFFECIIFWFNFENIKINALEKLPIWHM